MKLIVALIVSLPLFSLAGEIPGGTYRLQGLTFTEWTQWTCEGTRWKPKSTKRQIQKQTRDLKIKDLGWALTTSGVDILKPGTTDTGCTYLHGTGKSTNRNSHVLIPYKDGSPSSCLTTNDQVVTLTMGHEIDLPLGPCTPARLIQTGTFKFRYGYDLNSEGQVIWNPQPIETVSR
ncbi:hypothetical protein ACNQKP_02945 [Bdellovibrio bacteriovorus]|uniref:hypothetical protein n=1 Tax=Bdellovibrio bacteriovorus TaxID=959 RepID=UPI003AA7FB81